MAVVWAAIQWLDERSRLPNEKRKNAYVRGTRVVPATRRKFAAAGRFFPPHYTFYTNTFSMDIFITPDTTYYDRLQVRKRVAGDYNIKNI